MKNIVLIDQIDAVLPQTQCGECGFGACRPYAEALAVGTTTIDHCPPGGVKTLEKLGTLLNCDPAPYYDELIKKTKLPSVAMIIEDVCIGCTKCIQACPTDAIIGTGKWMHTVLEDACTGCGLCVPPCPVDCIELIPVARSDSEQQQKADEWRARYQKHIARIEQEKQIKAAQHLKQPTADLNIQRKQEILEALTRVKAKKGSS